MATRARLGTNIVMALMVAGVFQSLNGPDRFIRYNMMGCLFFLSVNTLMLNFLGTVGLF